MIYPTVMLFPTLTSKRDSHLGLGLSDVDGAVQNATILKNVGLALSGTQGFTAFPDGEQFWRIEMVSQAISAISFWLMVQVFRPMLAVNLFILFGWILSGVLVYLIAKQFQASTLAALVCSISSQALLSTREQVSNYVSYVWLAVPLGLVYLFVRNKEMKVKHWIPIISGYLCVTAFFDPYWFFFEIFIVLVGVNYVAVNRIRISTKSILFLTRVSCFLLLIAVQATSLGIIFGWLVSKLDPVGQSRRIAITSNWAVKESSSHVLGFLSPPDGHLLSPMFTTPSRPVLYVGIITLAFALVAAVAHFRNSRIGLLVVLTAMLWALSLQPSFELVGINWTLPSEWARRMMPGVQYLVRASFISQALLFVLAAIGITRLSESFKRNRLKIPFVLIFGLLIFVDVGGLVKPMYTSDANEFTAMRTVLEAGENNAILALPRWKVGRGWHEQWILNVPFVNGAIENGILADVDRSAAAGPGSLASFLASQEITHVLAPRDYKMTTHSVLGQKNFKLQSPRFIEVASANTWGYENGLIELVLYKVSPFLGDQPCSECLGYSQIITSPNMVRDGEQPYFWSTYMGGTLSAHIGGPLGIWKIQDRPQLVDITFGALTTQVLEITDGVQKIKLQIPAGAIRTVQLKQDQAREISINPLKKCYTPQEMNPEVNDTRPLCFRIDSVRINLVEENHVELENR